MKNDFEIRGEVTAIFIESKYFGRVEALIDTKDLAKVQEFSNKWILLVPSGINKIYVQGCLPRNGGKQKRIFLHRWLTNANENQVVDHINHDTFDNRQSNLRICSQKENARNAQVQKRGNSRFKGVHWREDRQKFQAYITVNRKRKYLGHFDSEKAAAVAYNNAALENFGEFAVINEI